MQDIEDMLVPDVESDIPLPSSATDPMADLSPADELAMRARTIKLLADLKGESLIPTAAQQFEAEDIARKMMSDPKHRPDFAKYPNETMAYLAGMVAQSNCSIVEELSDLKNYVINKLVTEVESTTDAKARISALKLLGEVDGVDAFKRRSEVTMQIKPIEEVEKELLTILEGVEYKVMSENE